MLYGCSYLDLDNLDTAYRSLSMYLETIGQEQQGAGRASQALDSQSALDSLYFCDSELGRMRTSEGRFVDPPQMVLHFNLK